MRINKFVAGSSSLSRRAADVAIIEGRIKINGQLPIVGQTVESGDVVSLDGQALSWPKQAQTIMLNKPEGYVTSRNGQGSRTIYDLLPKAYHQLIPIGRLDKDSSGLLLLTNDGAMANQLTHPSFGKLKVYEVELDQELSDIDHKQIEHGIRVEDYTSRLQLEPLGNKRWKVTMSEGRNRQIRKTFARLDYEVIKLHRTKFGEYQLDQLETGTYKPVLN